MAPRTTRTRTDGPDTARPDLAPLVLRPEAVAEPAQVVVAANVRITVLTERLFRLEYAADGVFEDRPSLAVVNRVFPGTEYRSRTEGNALTVATGAVTIDCRDVTRPFTGRTLSAKIAGSPDKWSYGKVDRRNLGGTVRTLDGWDGNKVARFAGWDDETGVINAWDEQDLGRGLCTRGGWTVFDDSGTVVLDPGAGSRAARGRPWPAPRPAGVRQDLYLFAYGADHASALAAAARLFGPQPLPPRFAFGYWYSRYFPYTSEELLAVVAELDQHRIPADVLVIDMDWHKLGWTGYSWDRELFPDPTATLAAVHERDLRVCLNLHPADGVGRHEDAFVAFCEALGLDPASTVRVPFDPTDTSFVDAYLRLLHHPEEDRGVDFWWLDWQQGTESSMPGLDPLAWLNHLHWEDARRRRPGRRPLIFSRWDGLGAGRHPIGFSGDTYATWESLAFQPEVTATAANVLYGYWSHDIGGHFGGSPDPELYTRWLQLGAHSPVLRTHATLDPLAERRVWEFTDPYRRVMIATIRRRYELVPYIYGECRRGLDDGRSLVRPMYHEYPDLAAAYRAPGQYLFGTDMIVAPVVSPVEDDSMAPVRVWLPPGGWYDSAHGEVLTVARGTGQWFTRRYLLDEVPVFVRTGAVIPGQEAVDRLSDTCYPNLVLTIHPGPSGSAVLYEDDGTSQGYLTGSSVELPVSHECSDRHRVIDIGPARGSYRGWRRRRPVSLRLPLELPPSEVRVAGRDLGHSVTPEVGSWSYEPTNATLVITLPPLDLRSATRITITRRSPDTALNGVVGLMRRLMTVDLATRTLLGNDNRRMTGLRRELERIATEPDSAAALSARLRAALPQLVEVLAEHAEGQRSLEALNPQAPPTNSVILENMRRLLERTAQQFGGG